MAPPQAKTPVMVLQELTVKNKWAPPNYNIVHCIQGTHSNRFDYKVYVHGITGHGSGPSKQIGKHQAAMNALLELKEMGVYDPILNPVTPFDPAPSQKRQSPDEPPCEGMPEPKFEPSFTYIMTLKELCSENKMPEPVFEEISDVGPPHAKEFMYECRVASIKTQGIASTKKMARHVAAKDMLDRIKDTFPELSKSGSAGDSKVSTSAIMDVDNVAVQKYAEFDDFIADKSIKIMDYGGCIKKIMNEKELQGEDFIQLLANPSLPNLELILDKLELKYITCKILDRPHMLTLSINTNSPYTTIGISDTSEELALQKAVEECFTIMKCFMGLPDRD